MRRLAAAAILTLAFAPSSSASTVEVRSVEEEEGYFVTTVHITSGAGEVNTMSVRATRGVGTNSETVVHDETAPVSPGDGCTAVDPQTVRCGPVHQVFAQLGDMDDVASVSATGQLPYVSLSAGEGEDELTCSPCTMQGGPGGDQLTGGAAVDVLEGDAGVDVLSGGGEGDSLYGGPHDDVIHGGPGHDNLYGGGALDDPGPSGADHLDGGPDADSLSDLDSDVGPDTLIGGDGSDYVFSYLSRTEPVFIDLSQPAGAGQEGENDTLNGIENAEGGHASDVLVGDAGPNRLNGWGGDDVISGAAGNDELRSEAAGYDRLSAGSGDDAIVATTILAGDFTCDAGEDRVDMNEYTKGSARTLGPLVDGSCERIEMGRFSLDPLPVRVGRRGRLIFEFDSFRCCNQLLRLKRADAPWRSYDKKRIRNPRVRVRAPRRLARRWREGPVMFRAKVDRAADAPFVWRFVVDRSGG